MTTLKYVLNTPIIVLIVWLSAFVCSKEFNSSFTHDHLEYLRSESKSLFQHAWRSYMDHGFPADEVRPISCQKHGPDFKDPYNIIRNDPMGNYSSTMLDNIDSLIVMEEWDELEYALDYLKSNKDDIFNQDTIVQVFEVTVRALGGLLSAHLLLVDVTNINRIPSRYERYKSISANYDGFLLDIAYDLGTRLVGAFKTKHNVPLPRINLARGVNGVPLGIQSDTCASGAMTPVLEFTLLSKLTGDPQFENLSQLTFWKLWSSKSHLDLLPMTLNPMTNEWVDEITGIGASIDSFYEYAAKASIVFDDDYMWSVFKASYNALLTHSAQGGGPHEGAMIFPNIRVNDGSLATPWIDSLGGFWSGLQVLTGQLSDAIRTHLVYLKLWDYFDSVPERWNHYPGPKELLYGKRSMSMKDVIPLEWYPLRPEFIESTYYLYRATRDPMYLNIGERILHLFEHNFKSACGFHGIQNTRTGEPQDRMETFVMSESLKYLYLLFDTDDQIFLHTDMMKSKNWVFSTEAHPLWFNKKLKPKRIYSFPETKTSDYKHKKSRSFFPNIKRPNPHKKELTSLSESRFYRNVSHPEVEYYDIPNYSDVDYIEKVDAMEARYSMCEVTPFESPSKTFMYSAYYAWDAIFDPDYLFRHTLIRPKHLTKSHLDGSYIELTREFYQKFSLFVPQEGSLHLQSARESDTEQYEIIFGDIADVSSIEISRLQYAESHTNIPSHPMLLEHDLWVPHINALRVKMEKLTPGAFDSRKRFVSEDYVQAVRVDDYNPHTGSCSADNHTSTSPLDKSTVLRILKINGVFVGEGQVVWILPFESSSLSPDGIPSFSIASDGRVVLQGTVIENMMVYSG